MRAKKWRIGMENGIRGLLLFENGHLRARCSIIFFPVGSLHKNF